MFSLQHVRQNTSIFAQYSAIACSTLVAGLLSGCQTSHQQTSPCVRCGKPVASHAHVAPAPAEAQFPEPVEHKVNKAPLPPTYIPDAESDEPQPLFVPGAQANPLKEPTKSTWLDNKEPTLDPADPFSASISLPETEASIQSVGHTTQSLQNQTAHWPVLNTNQLPLSQQRQPVQMTPESTQQTIIQPAQWPYGDQPFQVD